ncbi:MAG TPA: AI-2E family transporter [Candidatus Baltobacteraceae bacterium]|nr:AI-2E family transporter [Candidatus Baltobacteraceae bacterium]
MNAKDLREEPPRRWSEELGGIAWLPRMIDKARAAMQGTLGDYLYGQSPFDQGLLRALGISYRDFTTIVRRAGDDDEKVLALIQLNCGRNIEAAQKWGQRLKSRNRVMLALIDSDDGYSDGPLLGFRGAIRMGAALWARYLRYRYPSRAQTLGLEVEAQVTAARAEAARGAEEEPYKWFTEHRLDVAWKLLLSVVLIFLIFTNLMQFVERISAIVVVIVGAIFFAYLVYPLVRFLNRKLPLIVAILLVYATIAAIVFTGLMYLIPALSFEVTTLTHDWPAIQHRLVAFLRDPKNPVVAHAPPFIRDEIAKLPVTVPEWLQKHGAAAFGNAITVLLASAAFLGAMIAIPVLGAYLLYDSETIKRFFMGFIPPSQREATLDVLGELETVIGGFIRGQLLVGFTVGIFIALGLFFVGLPYAIVIAAIAALLDFIPYIGPVIAFIPAMVIALVNGGFPLVVKVAIVFVIANQLEGHVIAPNIVSRTIQLSPSAVVLSILIGGELYGVIGMFVAVPIAGVLRVLILRVIPGSVSRDEARPVLTKDPHDSIEEGAAP